MHTGSILEYIHVGVTFRPSEYLRLHTSVNTDPSHLLAKRVSILQVIALYRIPVFYVLNNYRVYIYVCVTKAQLIKPMF